MFHVLWDVSRSLIDLLVSLALFLISLVLSLAILFHVPTTNHAQAADSQLPPTKCDFRQPDNWTWTNKSGGTQSQNDLQVIIKGHERWIGTSHKEGTAAELSASHLKGANLRSVNLSEADFTKSNLGYVDFYGANLAQAVFEGAKLECARLVDASLHGANLTKADLSTAMLSGARFDQARLDYAVFKNAVLLGVHFTDARMSNADLSGADLTNAELNGALLSEANLRGARLVGTRLHAATVDDADFFEAIYESTDDPVLRSIAFAKNLEYMTHRNNPEPLARLRSKFKEAGFREQERKITFALKTRQTQFLWETCAQNKGNCFEYWVNRLLFDLPSQYGMNPGRVLVLIVSIFGTCTLLYRFLIHTSQTSGLAIVVPKLHDNQPRWLLANLTKKHEVFQEGSTEYRAFKVQPRDLSQYKQLTFARHLLWRESSLIWVSLVFSLMSTFNIKFREIDFGRWIKLLTVKEYNVRGVGWARTISGVQALCCVYLIALLLITYFGRPFE
jgi:uncharacterized protein YjbI with pentapeptide repeats